MEIEDWNEYGELKQHVTIYYDEFTQPPISQAPKTPAAAAQPPKQASSLAASSSAPSAGIPPPAAPPLPDKKDTTTTTGGDGADEKKQEGLAGKVAETAAKVALPIRSIAEEAAAKAKEVRLQSLRDKVYGKGGQKGDTKGGEGKEEDEKVEQTAVAKDASEEEQGEKSDVARSPGSPTPVPLTPSRSGDSSRVAGMQSPTTGTWRDGASTDNVLRTLQSPTTTSWKPTDVDAPITSYMGSVVASASEEEIAAIERAETIDEEEEPDSSEGEEEGEKAKKK